MVRELLGTGKAFGIQIMPEAVDPALVFVLAPGAFITLGIMMALLNQRKISKKKAK